MDDDHCKECYDCKSVFTTWRRKHHCRICGTSPLFIYQPHHQSRSLTRSRSLQDRYSALAVLPMSFEAPGSEPTVWSAYAISASKCSRTNRTRTMMIAEVSSPLPHLRSQLINSAKLISNRATPNHPLRPRRSFRAPTSRIIYIRLGR